MAAKFTESEVKALRAETPGAAHVTHLENAGSALLAQPTINAVNDFFKLETMIGGYAAKERCAEEIEGTYSSIGRLLNCNQCELAVVDCATRAWALAFYSLTFQEGETILVSMAEYASNYIAYLQQQRKYRFELKVIPDNSKGQVDLEALEKLIDSSVRLIAVTHIPTNGGLVNPAEEVGKVASAHGIPYLLDACQSVGQYPLDVEKLQCTFLSGTGRKFLRAPRGTGFLYVRKTELETIEPVMLDLYGAAWIERDGYALREDARRFETWEKNYAGILGLKCAVDYALELGIGRIWSHISLLGEEFREKLAVVPGVRIRDSGDIRCGIVTLSIEGHNPLDIAAYLTKQNINCSTSTLLGTRLDMENRRLKSVLRLSVHYYNTSSELDRCVEAIRKAVTKRI